VQIFLSSVALSYTALDGSTQEGLCGSNLGSETGDTQRFRDFTHFLQREALQTKYFEEEGKESDY
jgi:hypothetical protein